MAGARQDGVYHADVEWEWESNGQSRQWEQHIRRRSGRDGGDERKVVVDWGDGADGICRNWGVALMRGEKSETDGTQSEEGQRAPMCWYQRNVR